MKNEKTEKKTSLWGRLRERLTPDEMFVETEVQANKLAALILFCSGIIIALILVLTAFGLFLLPMESVFSPLIQALAEVVILIVVCRVVKYRAWWLKHLLMLAIILVYARLDCVVTHKAAILMVLPVVLSSRYFSRRVTVFTSLVSTVAFAASAVYGATHGMINLNIVTMDAGTTMTATGGFLGDTVKNAGVSDAMLIKNTMLFDYLPKWLMFSIATIVSCNIARRGRDMVVTQHDKDVETARISTELNLATRIQADMVPNIYPAFPDRREFDVYATMDPAKEVGGDFYDFFLIDDDHLCLVMADVSGKGVPAALFMMASKIILANNAMIGKSPAQILTDANAAICSHNREEMFVTVWLGILEISTGKLVAANAGHEYPVVKHGDGSFEVLRDKHGFVIGGMAGMKYKEYELTLEPGSKLFLYTDGVPEATDAESNMFGADRMLEALNEKKDGTTVEILKHVRASVDGFVKDAEQFDDLTMLCMEYRGPEKA
ncbi:MAG: serine/threonine-protein phosphatase [Clostridia bacterium]|nr:serine/threonine-protein phosphatase [Clostridia bacterium]